MKLRKIALTTAAALLVLAGSVTLLPLRAIAGLETPCNFISDLVATNPLSSDLASTGDDHMRCIKLALKTSFPGVSGAVTSSHTELNYLDGATGTTGTGNTVRSISPTFTGTVTAAAADFSGQSTFTALVSTGAAQVTSTAPTFALNETDADTGDRLWRAIANGEVFSLQASANDGSTSTSWIDVNRTDNTIDSIALSSTTLNVSGQSIFSATGSTGAVQLSSTAPIFTLNETDGATGNRLWRAIANGEQFSMQASANDGSTSTSWVDVNRTNNTIDSINLQATAVQINGGTITYGTYSPTATAELNLDSVSASTAQYARVGNTVTVSGEATIDPTAGTSSTTFRLSLPVSSNIGATAQCGGAGVQNYTAFPAAFIRGDATNDACQFLFQSGGTGSTTLNFSFTYLVN